MRSDEQDNRLKDMALLNDVEKKRARGETPSRGVARPDDE